MENTNIKQNTHNLTIGINVEIIIAIILTALLTPPNLSIFKYEWKDIIKYLFIGLDIIDIVLLIAFGCSKLLYRIMNRQWEIWRV